ncbi:MAG: hypothetical protein ACTSRL_17875 [Candidatus Helarchaeota archaeon]
MSDLIGFHGNMVWLENNTWNGFGFFGQSNHGKIPLCFTLAKKLIESGKTIKIFDDSFKLEGLCISRYQNRNWDDPDLLGY